jgi:hypothetical protein
MKKKLPFSLTVIILILLGNLTAGIINASPVNPNAKANGQIPIPVQVVPSAPVQGIGPSTPNGGSLIVPLDGSFTQAYFNADPQANPAGYRTDDGSTNVIPFQFTFCFYGTSSTECYINANGNVSFGAPYSQFTSTGFPVSGFPMLAPFWADVDNRPTDGGLIWYKSTATAFIVIWDHVGYFSEQTDKLNTFELIFTNGTDPLIGVGNNVAFSYQDMTWTTGSASDGVGGFGGTPATVGINKGDGTLYALVGRFDHAGTDFYGPGGAPGGVGYLSNQNFAFNACPDNTVIINSIPTLTQWGLIILGMALLALGSVYILRKRGITA